MAGKSKASAEHFEKLAEEGYEAYVEGDFETAEAASVKALEMARELGIKDMRLASVLNTLGGVQRACHQEEEAFRNCVAAFKIMERECQPGDSDLIGVAGNLAQMALNLGRDEEALDWSRRAWELARQGALPDRAKAAIFYTDALLEGGRAAEALDLLVAERDALLAFLSSPADGRALMTSPLGEMIKEEFRDHGCEPSALLLLRIQIAKARHALGQADDSIEKLPEMGTFEGRTHGEGSRELGMEYQRVGVTLHLLAQATKKRTHFAKAEEYYRRSLAILEAVCDEDDDHLRRARDNMEELQGDMRSAR